MSRINNQIQHKISEMTELGQKKKEAQEHAREVYTEKYGSLEGYEIAKTYTIRSINTAKTYRKAGEQFAKWLYEKKSINKINKVTPELAGEYLQHRDKTLSAWTVKRDMAMINKVFDYNIKSDELGLKKRKITDITRSRSGPDMTRPGLLKKYENEIFFIEACGARRDSITRVKYNDVIFENNIAVSVNLKEKGGKERVAPVLKIYRNEFTELINQYEATKTNIFKYFDNHVEAHYYRHLYAVNLYEELSKELESSGEFFKGYRKEVLSKVSAALGHGDKRFSTVVNNYLY